MSRVGVFLCWCGENIARTVDVERAAEEIAQIPGVQVATTYKYMCSDPGQTKLRTAIETQQLDGIVVAACSPHMHLRTFRNAAALAGLNPYLVEMANVREHCSWVHHDRDEATAKAVDIVRMAVNKVKANRELNPIRVPVTKRALVIGAGVAGIQAALDIADAGYEVALVEREPSVGGKMAGLSETFPTLDCSQCILTPRMVEVGQHPRIKLYSYSEVEKVEGFVGNFTVTIRKKARYVDTSVCTGCGDCWNLCPVKKIPSEFDYGTGTRRAVYIPFPQAVPARPVMDAANCTYLKDKASGRAKARCGACAKKCAAKAINFDDADELVVEQVGAVVDGHRIRAVLDRPRPTETRRSAGTREYGHGQFPDVIDGLQFERLVSAPGRPGASSADRATGRCPRPWSSSAALAAATTPRASPTAARSAACTPPSTRCSTSTRCPTGTAHVFYMDIRAGRQELRRVRPTGDRARRRAVPPGPGRQDHRGRTANWSCAALTPCWAGR